MSTTNQLKRVTLADVIWNSLAKNQKYQLFYPLLKDAIHPLFDEAIQCFKDGDYHATVALCRSATEYAVLASASIHNIKFSDIPNKNQQFVSSFDLAEEFTFSDYPNYNRAFAIGKTRKIIDSTIEKKINQIRTNGNFVMHYYNLLHRRLMKHVQTITRGENSNMNMVITEKEAEITLKDTSFVLKRIGSNLLDNPPLRKDRPNLRFVLGTTFVFVIAFLIIFATVYMGFNKTAVTETEVGLLTAYEFFIYNKYSTWFVNILKVLVPKNVQSKLAQLSSKLPPRRRTSIASMIGATMFLVIFLFMLALGSATVAGGVLALDFSLNSSYITIETEVLGGIVGSWALNLFFKVFRIQ